MCLLVFAWQVETSHPLVVAANRDERLDRPALPFGVLQRGHPRMLGGRDELAGGTWLAVNEHGVVAGLTNRPAPEGRDPTKRSRGGLPLVVGAHTSAASAAADLAALVRPADYNPAWMLLGDRQSLHYVDLTGGERTTVQSLGPGVHVLENAPLGHASGKVDQVRSLVETALRKGEPLWSTLEGVLADHGVPRPAVGEDVRAGGRPRPPATRAACVHTDGYGTRSATLVRVPKAPSALPQVLAAEGPPCATPFSDVSAAWCVAR